LKRLREIDYGESGDPVEAYLNHQRRNPKSKQRRVTHRVAEAARAVEQGSAGGNRLATGTVTATPATPDHLPARVIPEIGKGQIFR